MHFKIFKLISILQKIAVLFKLKDKIFREKNTNILKQNNNHNTAKFCSSYAKKCSKFPHFFEHKEVKERRKNNCGIKNRNLINNEEIRFLIFLGNELVSKILNK